MMYEYPAIISYEKNDGVYYVDFPDISGCFTDGLTLRETLDNAEDALKTMLECMEFQNDVFPQPSNVNSFSLGVGQIVALVSTEIDAQKIAV